MEINDILYNLKGVRKLGPDRWIARCCAHDDHKPSLSIKNAGGKILLHCFTGCSYDAITAALGIDTSKPLPAPVPQIRKAIEDKPIDAQAMWQRWFERTDHDQLDSFGVSLGVDTDCLKAIGCAWSTFGAWAFPMREPNGKVIGIRLRNDKGDKWAVKGSKSGLFIPSDYSYIPDRVLYLVEGPTDLAAAMTIGLRAFGRAACLGQEDLILAYIAKLRVDRLVIVTDNDDEKLRVESGRKEPGLRGAEKLQAMLPILSCIWVPPTKDIREFVNLGGRYNTMQAILKDLVWTRAARRAA